MFEILSFCDQEIVVITFLVNQNYYEAFRSVYFFIENTSSKLEVKSRTCNTVLVLVLESQGFYCRITSDFSAINKNPSPFLRINHLPLHTPGLSFKI